MSVVIKVENLSKYYRLGVIGGGTLREDLSRWWALRRGMPDPLLRIGEEDHGNRKGGQIWALRDINFQVSEGEILGLIGGNGAGKSTLLKILSRITSPTSGDAKIVGKVASLLEVGTGFHPELTGRENIYLNGAILGMPRKEVSRKLAEIVAFADIERFVDTPVKRYSSGMTVRLAFAVAAHLEPEILLIDEVLAVGDAAFQRKCLGKMKSVARSGRTVLFVSHNMGSINGLCDRGILLEAGSIVLDGEVSAVVRKYLSSGTQSSHFQTWEGGTGPGDDICQLNGISIAQVGGQSSSVTEISRATEISLDLSIANPVPGVGVSLFITDVEEKVIVHTSSLMSFQLHTLGKGRHRVTAKLPAYLLNKGTYQVSIAADISNNRIIFHERNLVSFEVEIDCPKMGHYSSSAWKGVTGPGIAQWEVLPC